MHIVYDMTEIFKMASDHHHESSYVYNFVKSHSRKLKFCYIVAYKVIHIGIYFHKCSFQNYMNIQDGVHMPYWIHCFANRLI